MLTLFIDIQGSKLNDVFYIKEYASLKPNGVISHLIFKPPFNNSLLDEQSFRQLQWLERHYENIPWNIGDIAYSEVSRRIYNDIDEYVERFKNPVIYIKGEEKAKWLCYLIPRYTSYIFNIEQYFTHIPKLSYLQSILGAYRCRYHRKNCALANVQRINRWWLIDRNFK